jgi:hypothetical protein
MTHKGESSENAFRSHFNWFSDHQTILLPTADNSSYGRLTGRPYFQKIKLLGGDDF